MRLTSSSVRLTRSRLLGLGDAHDLQRQRDVALDRAPRIERRRLEDIAIGARLRAPRSGVMPLTVIVPAVGCSRSAMTRSNVVLPQPDGPMKRDELALADRRGRRPTAPGPARHRSRRSRPRFVGRDDGAASRAAAILAVGMAALRQSQTPSPECRDALDLARRGQLLPGRQRLVDRRVRLAALDEARRGPVSACTSPSSIGDLAARSA